MTYVDGYNEGYDDGYKEALAHAEEVMKISLARLKIALECGPEEEDE